MQIKKYILLLASVLFVVACSNDDFTHQEPIQDGPVKVGFWMGKGDSENTRTFINDDGQTISWEAEDKVGLWAQKDGAYTLQNRTFDTWFVAVETNQAFFTTELTETEAMPEGTYTYYACYPLPQSVSGTTATFTLPSTQDGKMGGGADIMVAQGTGPALAKLYDPEAIPVPDYIIEDGLTLNMHHLIHALRFYVPAGKWGFPTGETVERIVFTMPANVAGTVTADVSNTNGLTLTSGGTNTISLNLKEPIGASAADNGGNITYDYAAATILPGTYSGNMTVKVYSQTKASQVTIPIDNRTMVAGHITPVGLNCSETVDQYYLRFVYAGNNLGEDVTEVRVKYTDENGTSQTLTIPGSQFIKDGYYDVDLTDWDYNFSALRSVLRNQVITVEYESEHAIVSEQVTLPDVTQKGVSIVNLVVPYLFFEDFESATESSMYYDGDGVFSTQNSRNSATNLSSGDYTWPSYLNATSNWTGARCGLGYNANDNNAIRVNARAENAALAACNYNGRVDSPNMMNLKADATNVKLRISFNYSFGRQQSAESGIFINRTPQQHYFAIGTHTTQGAIDGKSSSIGATSWSYTINANIAYDVNTMDMSGSFTTVDKSLSYEIGGCQRSTRFVWEPYVKNKSNDGYYNYWLYLDNIKVQIVSE